MKRVLIIAAHPDDDILGCGGFISKYSSYKQIRVIFIGEGSSCRFEKFDDNRNLIKDEIGKRNDFGKKALNKLKINNYHFYNLPCGRFDQIPLIEINQIIENEIIKFKPDTVFTHSADDTNHDHKVVFNSSSLESDALPIALRQAVHFELLWLLNKKEYYGLMYREDLNRIEMLESRWKVLSAEE